MFGKAHGMGEPPITATTLLNILVRPIFVLLFLPLLAHPHPVLIGNWLLPKEQQDLLALLEPLALRVRRVLLVLRALLDRQVQQVQQVLP